MCLIINAYINKEEILQIDNNFISHRTRKEHVKPKVFREDKKDQRRNTQNREERKKKLEISKNKSWFWKRYMQLTSTQLDQPGDKKNTQK